MPPTTTRELQAQVHLLAVVVSGVLAELPEGAASRVRTALENVLRAQAPLPEDIDAATARLASMVVAPVPLIAGRRARPGSERRANISKRPLTVALMRSSRREQSRSLARPT